IEINDLQLICSIKEASEQLGHAMHGLDQALITLAAEDFWKDLDTAVNNVGEFAQKGIQPMENIGRVAKDLAQGRGTLGKLIQDDELYEKTLDLLSQSNNLVGNVNNYGLLFHLNKGWQRQHAIQVNRRGPGRLNHSYRSSPELRRKMKQDIDQMSQNIQEIQAVLKEAQYSGNPTLLRQNSTNLIAQVRCLEERLDCLNAELTDLQRAE
ncbi:MAG: hypothetical protein JSR80_06235, partial [Verrucomicrobia bacterium]|nr:hypothetical protein [Verrucomicrobiota bacterium]